MKEESKLKYIFVELVHHLPFSIFGVILSILLLGLLSFFVTIMRAQDISAAAFGELFHIFHPVHILFSAVATTSMFWKHERSIVKAVFIGFIGSVFICGLSDIILPFCGGILLGREMQLHICFIRHPVLILTFSSVGILAGLLINKNTRHSTEYSHSAHVFISSSASILYLISYGLTDWTHLIGAVFLIAVFAVMIPCCASDIVFPLACTHRACEGKCDE